MIHLTLPNHDYRPLPFYLAMEEWVATKLPADYYFFSWIVEPTVIIGRHQDIDKEVDRRYCKDHNIAVYRRKSGGGCVFADCHNIMVSHIAPLHPQGVQHTFTQYTELVAKALRAMGLNASPSGRNDICIDGGKVSGNAFYHTKNRGIMHGTMLFDTDMTHIVRAITPDRAKLESKGVKSVKSRITTVRRHLPEIDLGTFRRQLTENVATAEIVLTQKDIDEINEIARPYFRQEWIEGAGHRYGVAPGANVTTCGRYCPGVGSVQLHIDTDADGKIRRAWLTGDFMDSIDTACVDSLVGEKNSQQLLSSVMRQIAGEQNQLEKK